MSGFPERSLIPSVGRNAAEVEGHKDVSSALRERLNHDYFASASSSLWMRRLTITV